MPYNPNSAQNEFRRLRQRGVTLPSEPIQARLRGRQMGQDLRSGSFMDTVSYWAGGDLTSPARRGEARAALRNFGEQRASGMGQGGRIDRDNLNIMNSMKRRGSTRTAAMHGTDAQWAWPKLHDPFEYWRERTWWFNMEDPEEQQEKIRDFCRLMYVTHYLVPGLIDIYSRWPLQDIEFVHKDKRLVEFFEETFFDDLKYNEHLFDMGREFWTVGEVFSLGSWHDGIGSWEDDEIINPNDVVVARNRALRTYQFHIKIPSEIKKLIDTREPEAEYQTLVQLYPDLVAWAREDKEIPVSDVLMHQQKFKVNPWSEHGTPILMRAFRMLMLEESLNAAQDAVADRLYSPLILATLGLPDVDEDGPWIPDASELQALRDDLGLAINSDFRMMVYHHGLKIENAWGREAYPRFDQDFLRVESKVMQVFGIGAEMLQGGRQTSGTYASGALNRELITQLLETYQTYQKDFLVERMKPVCEAQEFYEYEKVGGRYIPVMENVLVFDEESGEEYIMQKPKLAYPEVRMKTMNLRDENVERAFLMQLNQAGFPVSYSSLAVNIPVDFKEEIETRKREKLDMVVAEQQYKKELFDRLTYENLTVPPELMPEYMLYLQKFHPEQQGEMQLTQQSLMMGDPSMGMPTTDVSGNPAATDLFAPGNIPDGQAAMMSMPPPGDSQPPESSDQRGGMPTASRNGMSWVEYFNQRGQNVRKAAEHLEELLSVTDPNFSYDWSDWAQRTAARRVAFREKSAFFTTMYKRSMRVFSGEPERLRVLRRPHEGSKFFLPDEDDVIVASVPFDGSELPDQNNLPSTEDGLEDLGEP